MMEGNEKKLKNMKQKAKYNTSPLNKNPRTPNYRNHKKKAECI